ncbi:MAG: hypothetical protein FD123_84 [Bacteroidetes bacterium]|nr:MAG: hypothetical protein FD123_84 [Bacteroidota bacterium]
MKTKRIILFFSATAFLLSLAACGDDPWSRQGNKEFTAEFPGKAQDTATIEDNMATLRLFYQPTSAADPNAYYDVSVCTMPTVLDSFGVNLDDALLADAKVYAWSIDGEVIGKGTPVKSGKYNGYEYIIDMPQKIGRVVLRKFVSGKKMYTLKVITPAEQLGNEHVKHFLESFELK